MRTIPVHSGCANGFVWSSLGHSFSSLPDLGDVDPAASSTRLSEWWPSRLAATAAEKSLSIQSRQFQCRDQLVALCRSRGKRRLSARYLGLSPIRLSVRLTIVLVAATWS